MIGISIQKDPDKTQYIYGQPFDATGMVVVAQYNNGDSEEIIDYIVDEMVDATGLQDLTISYGKFSTKLTIYVSARALQSIAITKKPDKTNI